MIASHWTRAGTPGAARAVGLVLGPGRGRRPRPAGVAILLGGLLLLATACSSVGSVTPTASRQTGAPAATAVATPSPPARATGDAARGQQVFQNSDCPSCHLTTNQKLIGPGLAGVTKQPALPNGKPMTDANLAEWIKDGGAGQTGTMPSHPDLNAQQLADLVAYLKTLK